MTDLFLESKLKKATNELDKMDIPCIKESADKVIEVLYNAGFAPESRDEALEGLDRMTDLLRSYNARANQRRK